MTTVNPLYHIGPPTIKDPQQWRESIARRECPICEHTIRGRLQEHECSRKNGQPWGCHPDCVRPHHWYCRECGIVDDTCPRCFTRVAGDALLDPEHAHCLSCGWPNATPHEGVSR